MFCWYNIFETQADNMHVKLILEDLQDEFKREHPMEEISGLAYKKYELAFYESVALACDFVNRLIAHAGTKQ